MKLKRQLNCLIQKSQPFNAIKDNRDIFSNFVTRFFNSGISTSRFPTALKNTEVKPVFTSNILKYMKYFITVWIFWTHILKYQFGFGKGHSAQHCLLVMVEKWKKYFHKEGTWVLLTDLSKAFDCLPQSFDC